MGNIIDGREVSKIYKEEIKEKVQLMMSKGHRPPCMATILVGDDGGSVYYVKNQTKLCNNLGITAKNISLPENIKEEELLNIIYELNEDNTIDGIMLQVPLPKELNERIITSAIRPSKDIDGLTDNNLGRFYKGIKCFIPCTPRSVLELLKAYKVPMEGANVVVIGRSNIVGKPVSMLMLKENATVTICHSKTKNLKDIAKAADILICAMGKPLFIDDEYIKEGAVVMDVGTTMVNGEIKGDVDFQKVINKASLLTPVPGGVGSLTTTMLIKNTFEAYMKNVY